jgi:hypothetical protein
MDGTKSGYRVDGSKGIPKRDSTAWMERREDVEKSSVTTRDVYPFLENRMDEIPDGDLSLISRSPGSGWDMSIVTVTCSNISSLRTENVYEEADPLLDIGM